MKPILLHLHLYYQEMWPDLRQCIAEAGIPEPYTMWVTIPEHNADLEAEIRRFHPECNVLVVENRGFDIAPFLRVLSLCELDDYSYVVKLHSKRSLKETCKMNGFNMPADTWRRHLLSFMRPEHFRRTLEAFDKKPTLGMVGDFHLIYRGRDSAMQKKLMDLAGGFIQEMGFERPRKGKFVAGTMFICRASLLKPLSRLNIHDSDFSESSRDNIYDLPYILERLFGLVVYAQGYHIADPNRFSSPVQYIGDMFNKYVMPYIYRHSVNARGRHHLKIFKIPLPINTLIRLMDKGHTTHPSQERAHHSHQSHSSSDKTR